MAHLGNVWHIPANPEPPGLREGMRDPVFPLDSTRAVTVWTGNQFAGVGSPGNQLQDGSALLFRTTQQRNWTTVPLVFGVEVASNKYYTAEVPTQGLAASTVVEYYFRIAYDDHDTTFLALNTDGLTSLTFGDEGAARDAPFAVSIDTADKRGRWSDVIALPNVAIHAHLLRNAKVLMWGRRDNADQSLDVNPPSPLQVGGPSATPATCTPFIWDPTTKTIA